MRLFNTLAAAVLAVAAFTITPAAAQDKPVSTGNACEVLAEALGNTLEQTSSTWEEETALLRRENEIYVALKAENCSPTPILVKVAQLLYQDYGSDEKLYKSIGLTTSKDKPHDIETYCRTINSYGSNAQAELKKLGSGKNSQDSIDYMHAYIQGNKAAASFYSCINS